MSMTPSTTTTPSFRPRLQPSLPAHPVHPTSVHPQQAVNLQTEALSLLGTHVTVSLPRIKGGTIRSRTPTLQRLWIQHMLLAGTRSLSEQMSVGLAQGLRQQLWTARLIRSSEFWYNRVTEQRCGAQPCKIIKINRLADTGGGALPAWTAYHL